MIQYCVLCVDDEEEVFRLIMRKADWEKMGLSALTGPEKGEGNEETGEYMTRSIRAGELREILSRIREETDRKKESPGVDPACPFVIRAQEYVRDHYRDPDLSVEKVCRDLGVSTAYFSTVFKRETGKTFIRYLTDHRMQEAARRLTEEDEKVCVVARQTGYLDPNYFSSVFKKQFGLSPSEYRKAGGAADSGTDA